METGLRTMYGTESDVREWDREQCMGMGPREMHRNGTRVRCTGFPGTQVCRTGMGPGCAARDFPGAGRAERAPGLHRDTADNI